MSQREDVPFASRSTVLRFGDCELQVLTRELWRNGQRQAVSARVFDLMLLLIERRPRAVSHAEIAQAVWHLPQVRPNLLARAVMQVRQLTGDSADEPAHFLSVRGVGYRFAGTVTEGVHAQPGTGGAQAGGLDALHATLADADTALHTGDIERAQYLADQAVRLAEASGINCERSRALSLASQVAMKQGTLAQAAGLATQALRLADAEGHEQAAAIARLRLARVRISVGDLHGALALLEAAYGLLDAPDLLSEKALCEGLLAWAHREVGQFALAVSWCTRSQATARRGLTDPLAVRERTFEADLYLNQAEALMAQGQPCEAQRLYAHGLALNEALRDDAYGASDTSYRLFWLCNQTHALAGLGRLDDAWAQAEAWIDALQGIAGASSPTQKMLVATCHYRRADLYCRARRFDEAVGAAQQAVQLAEAADLQSELPRHLGMAAAVCEQAGRFQEALQWHRRAQAVVAALQVERASGLALVMHAETQADTLRRDLHAARELAQQLALENRKLSQRLEVAERARQLDDLGFTSPAFLRTTLEPRIADARLRDLPFCVALLSLDNHDALHDRLDAGVSRQLMRELKLALEAMLPPALDIVQWRPGLFLYALADIGPRRARQDCRRVEARLNSTPWLQGPGTALLLTPRWHVACVDATEDPSLDHCLARLLQAATRQAPAQQGTDADDGMV